MLMLLLQTITHQHPVFSQLNVKILVLTLPPLFIRLALRRPLLPTIRVQQIPLLTPQIV
jgi:hypothetical protein